MLRKLIFFLLLGYVFGYNNTFGLYNVRLSAIAYCPEETVENWSCYWCQYFPNAKVITTLWDSKTSTYAYIVYDLEQDNYILSFEGTQDTNDFLIDLQIAKLTPYKEHPTAKVHSGFWNAYLSIRNEILNIVEFAPRLFITGQSLGGALSTLASLDILEEYPNLDIYTVTFGSPRVGNLDYVYLYSSIVENSYRVTHGKDPVVHLPPEFLGFVHVPFEIYYPNNTMNYIFCSTNNCAEKEYGINLEDHSIYLDIRVPKC